jgi:hypothetical protein
MSLTEAALGRTLHPPVSDESSPSRHTSLLDYSNPVKLASEGRKFHHDPKDDKYQNGPLDGFQAIRVSFGEVATFAQPIHDLGPFLLAQAGKLNADPIGVAAFDRQRRESFAVQLEAFTQLIWNLCIPHFAPPPHELAPSLLCSAPLVLTSADFICDREC